MTDGLPFDRSSSIITMKITIIATIVLFLLPTVSAYGQAIENQQVPDCTITDVQDAKLDAIRGKIALTREEQGDVGLLALRSLPKTGGERAAIRHYMSRGRICDPQLAGDDEAVRTIISAATSHMEDWAVELYRGRISYGDFNRMARRASIDAEASIKQVFQQRADKRLADEREVSEMNRAVERRARERDDAAYAQQMQLLGIFLNDGLQNSQPRPEVRIDEECRWYGNTYRCKSTIR
jgi:hypothetical protein